MFVYTSKYLFVYISNEVQAGFNDPLCDLRLPSASVQHEGPRVHRS
jgi:hypothetical protein